MVKIWGLDTILKGERGEEKGSYNKINDFLKI